MLHAIVATALVVAVMAPTTSASMPTDSSTACKVLMGSQQSNKH